MTSTKRIAVLMCSYNRKEFTERAIASLYTQGDRSGLMADIYLLDDGSTDGTQRLISQLFPDVKVLQGDGNYFWNGGTNAAWRAAVNSDRGYDGYLWLNDDVQLHPHALETLAQAISKLMTQNQSGRFVVVGSTIGGDANTVSYGGFALQSFKGVLRRLNRILPDVSEFRRCDTMNGNFVYVTHKAHQKAGELDDLFVHSMGDIDYGLRCSKLGIPIYLLPETIGSCTRNDEGGYGQAGAGASSLKSYKKRFSIKQFPLRQWFTLTKRYYGPFFIVSFLAPYLPRFGRKKRIGFKR